MKAKVTSLVLVMLMMCTYVMLPTSAAAQNGNGNNPTRSLTVPVTGTADGNALTGLLKVTNFSNQNGKIFANGTLVASVTDTATGAVRNIVTPVSLPVNLPGTSGAAATAQQTTADCGILHLDLGPLDLNLLGLNVHLNEVVLDITAQSGPGNLLGNLLCSVSNLLNGGSPLSNVLNQITGLLNQILGAL